MQGRRPVDHAAQEAEQEQRNGMGAFGRGNEGEVAEELIADQLARSDHLRRRRPLGDRRHLEAGASGR